MTLTYAETISAYQAFMMEAMRVAKPPTITAEFGSNVVMDPEDVVRFKRQCGTIADAMLKEMKERLETLHE